MSEITEVFGPVTEGGKKAQAALVDSDPKAWIGKTIRVVIDGVECGKVIMFTDGTWTYTEEQSALWWTQDAMLLGLMTPEEVQLEEEASPA